MEEVQKYVIVGNGFDLNLGIKSSYGDFVEYIKSKFSLHTPEEVYEFNSLFVQSFEGYELNWSDFETVFENQILEINNLNVNKEDAVRKNYLISKLNTDLYELEKHFLEYLITEFDLWSKSIHKKKLNTIYKRIFSTNCKVLSFNFTDSIIKILDNENISRENIDYYQLHGSLKDNNIVFGGGFTGTDKVKQIFLDGSMNNDKLIRIKKDRSLVDTRRKYREQLQTLEDKLDVYILGHSIDGSDLSFLSELLEKSRNIYLFYYSMDFLPKLQSISKKLGREISEKVFLVPFFDVLVQEEENENIELSFDESDDENPRLFNTKHLQHFFNIPLPIHDDNYDYFKTISVNPNSFLFKDRINLKIESNTECETLLRILEKLRFTDLKNKEQPFISIQSVTNDELLNKLLGNQLFREFVNNTNVIEISNSSFSLVEFQKCFEHISLQRLVLVNNKIYVPSDENIVDLESFSRLEKISLINNEVIDGRIRLQSSIEENRKLKHIEIKDNEGFVYSRSIYEFAKYSETVVLPFLSIENSDEENQREIVFENIETATFYGTEDSSGQLSYLDGIKFGQNLIHLTLETMSLISSDDEKEVSKRRAPNANQSSIKRDVRKIGDLFSSTFLPNLECIEFNECDVQLEDYRLEHFNFYSDIFRKNVVIKFDDSSYLLRDIIEQFQNSNYDVPSKLQRRAQQASATRSNDKLFNEITIEWEQLEKSEQEKINQFAQEWKIDKGDMELLVRNLFISELRDSAEKNIKKKLDYTNFKTNDGKPISILEAKKMFSQILKDFISEIETMLERIQNENKQ